MKEVQPTAVVTTPRVEVMHQFRILAGGRHVTLPLACELVVARVAVEDRPCVRTVLAGILWPDRSDRDAGTLLRRALWRVNREVPGLLDGRGRQVGLAADVDVDLAEVHRLAEAVNQGSPLVSAHAVRLLQCDLLPQWSEDWLEAPRELLRQLRLHTLEALARNDLDAGRPGSALLASLAAVGIDPLRESAQRIVISAHLAEGNVSEALRHYTHYRGLLWREMRLRPSARLEALLTDGGQVLPLGASGGPWGR
ncbi:MAG: bacterial transcriptional activator domain-containing protein [Lapillicoccus sp.]